MNPTSRIPLMLSFFLGLPVPAYAMIELLPAFFAFSCFVVMASTLPFAVLLKIWLLSALRVRRPTASWKAIGLTALVETVMMTCSLLVFLFSMEPEVIALSHGAALFILRLFAGATFLYSVFATMPNLLLLRRVRCGRDETDDLPDRPGTAWLLSLPTALVMVLLIGGIYFANV